MNNSKTYNISMVRGDTLSFAFEISGVDNIDTAFFSVKVNPNDNVYVFQKSLDNGISLVETGKYRVRVCPEDTEDIEVGCYHYDLEISVNGDVFTLLRGKLKVDYNITQ